MSSLTYHLDNDEKKLVDAFNSGEFVKNGNLNERNTFFKEAVKETTKKKPVNLRLQEQDIQKIKALAFEQGIPYQTLIGSIIHQYVKSSSLGR